MVILSGYDLWLSSACFSTGSYAEQVLAAKQQIMASSLNSEINALGHQLERITERNRRYRDYTLNSLIYALQAVIAHLAIYRTYVTADLAVSDRDQRYIRAAIVAAKRYNQRVTEDIFDFIANTLLLRNLNHFHDGDRQAVIDFVMKFQQMTGPIMAKSMEDTLYYRYNRLVSLNEVGGNPEQFGALVATFHAQNAARAQQWRHSLLATSTHDTKRSEDVRARINVLSELPAAWGEAVTRWRDLNATHKTTFDDETTWPTANDEYLLYQTLIGIWPFGEPDAQELAHLTERVNAYMVKAAQEAKQESSWVNPNPAYLNALNSFVTTILTPDSANPFLADFQPFARHIAFFGKWNGLAQTVLKLTAPGVPDFYQGSELWDFALVDPDNRRPVGFTVRQQMLDQIQRQLALPTENRLAWCQHLLAHSVDGAIKLAITRATLDLRQALPNLFADGTYRPLVARGDKEQHVCAFARQTPSTSLITVAPRLVHQLTNGAEQPPIGDCWHATWLPLPPERAGRRYRNIFTGEMLTAGQREGTPCLELATILAHFPVAVLREIPAEH